MSLVSQLTDYYRIHGIGHYIDDPKTSDYYINHMCSYEQKSFHVSLCHRPWRLWQGLESRKEEGEETICDEGDA